MLSAKSDREKLTITIKKENKILLEQLAKAENRNLSRQIDYLIENSFPFTEAELVSMVEDVENTNTWLTSAEIKEKLGI